jgi:hypothetical protein
MPLAARAITRLGHAGTMATEMIATFGVTYATGQPLLVIVTKMVFNLARTRSEAKKLRDRAGCR